MSDPKLTHPVTCYGLFTTTAESVVAAIDGSRSGRISTQSVLRLGGMTSNKQLDMSVTLRCNTANINTLGAAGGSYFLAGDLIARNDGTAPIFTYLHKDAQKVGRIGEEPRNQISVVGLGYVTTRTPVKESGGTRLDVIIEHHGLDTQQLCSTVPFSVKYVIPSDKHAAKTHELFQIGQEVQVRGKLIDWDMSIHMAVVLVRTTLLQFSSVAADPSTTSQVDVVSPTTGPRSASPSSATISTSQGEIAFDRWDTMWDQTLVETNEMMGDASQTRSVFAMVCVHNLPSNPTELFNRHLESLTSDRTRLDPSNPTSRMLTPLEKRSFGLFKIQEKLAGMESTLEAVGLRITHDERSKMSLFSPRNAHAPNPSI
ncbi:hypothetical protein PSTT_03846 [Puccinia striiformis]|uniref:Uncharacterized protein n=1 Tax=Puccinia striiformis TaxID=27350 RepID=A0A2S4VV88_9BASI|nr:hypothetical protein PSTT_03846 [Puccinia striiformis]